MGVSNRAGAEAKGSDVSSPVRRHEGCESSNQEGAPHYTDYRRSHRQTQRRQDFLQNRPQSRVPSNRA